MNKSQIIQNFLNKNSVAVKVLEFSETTRTSQDAANQAGCELARIAKSIIFKLTTLTPEVRIPAESIVEEPILVITSGPNRVSEKKLRNALFQTYSQILKNLRIENPQIGKADADFVYEKTGFPIGGVPAFCHKTPIKFVFIDEDLIKFDKVWSAAGTPNAIFEIPTDDLMRLSNAIASDIKA
ncbi:MAG: hypothetical protein A2418_00435 [Candidatus Brennerbacteria bacterium RIFOXYC1_FULL_41_11]|uniref:YbaK/aminoacyl-tRNA synthetase-associated domain-containing protein n=1 Tax=Candidatus Brennerbacteria bacterium RIFOXYD1_FULL_41_16 TaxID=1797529 RepID=A0A1G1XLX7_9BACT|nr:MAG: hypothetical protein A2391_01895 [Candidatus Brennerbacteria bacterium RIFOXYB1_FULL_41_13]OGY39703.1 MAG: hypothetical protein A2418_00435 [Candidatus Brennerbacteria bacterium RIFOXYC1_FULL_41_11]OGY40327.1 MAG: hypothetical protein A2570_03560 [Candidatus Brennerbacteria bacterium RIFOXYD1_FULL_41_16]